LIAGVLVAMSSQTQAIDPSRVLVLFNNDSQESIDIANYYAQVHPGVNLLGLDNLGAATSITATSYLNNIRQPVLASGALTSNIDVILPTKGMPLRIQVEAAYPGPYIDSYGIQRFPTVDQWKVYSSLESELTKIDYINSETMMGDQSYNFPEIAGGHFASNAYYQSNASFSVGNFTGQHVMRLTARLDGFSVADVQSAIDRAQNAYVGPNNTPGGPFHFIVDSDPSLTYSHPTMTGANNLLNAKGLPHVYDNTAAFVADAGGSILGYTSNGVWQLSTPDDYIYALTGSLANGAVFNSWESFNAQSFQPGANYFGSTGKQALIGEWLNRGGTAAVGHVAEPGASPNGVINEDQLFNMLLEGKTFVEAAWSAARQLSFVNTVVGDPLMVWKQLLAGDANMDGVVDVGDLNAMGANWGKSVPAGGYGWTKGDLNGDGLVDFADLALVDASWGQASYWADIPANLEGPFNSPFAAALFESVHQNPEPSTFVLLSAGLAILGGFFWRRTSASTPGKPTACRGGNAA
jgi:uncharacterized protein (TIGR03790 family)